MAMTEKELQELIEKEEIGGEEARLSVDELNMVAGGKVMIKSLMTSGEDGE